MSNLKQPNHSAGNVGKYTCMRCGWRWTPRPSSPDPPRACARCRSAYWQSSPISSRANKPTDLKWQLERESVARRKRERHLARLKELAAEFGFDSPPIRDDLTFGSPAFRVPKELSRLGVEAGGPSVRFRECVPSPPAPAPSPAVPQAPRMSLSERLARAREADAKIARET
jgi:hypothetical protein